MTHAFFSLFVIQAHWVHKKNKMDNDTIWCSPLSTDVSTTKLSCVTVTLMSEWHPVETLRPELQKTVSHRNGHAAVTALGRCYKLILFDLFDAFDCQGTYNVTPCWLLYISSFHQWGVIMCVRPFIHGSLIEIVSPSWFAVCTVAGLYVDMSVCLCSLDSPLALSVFIEQPPHIPTIANLPAQTHRQYSFQSFYCVTVQSWIWERSVHLVSLHWLLFSFGN